jgi:hypothetical protein
MLHLDFDWDIHPDRIVLDEAFNSDKLGWKNGDIFKLVNVNGRQMLVKIDPVDAFVNNRIIVNKD